MPAHPKCLLTDDELLEKKQSGQSIAAIARHAGIRPQAVTERLQRLAANLPAPAARRAEETVCHTMTAWEALEQNQAILRELRDACLKQLEGEDGVIDVGPHDFDVEVLISRGGAPPQRVPLKSLLDENEHGFIAAIESKCADPRTLLTSVLDKIRLHIELAVKLAERVHQVEEVRAFQADVLAEIHAADPETAARIRGRLRARQEMRLALAPPGYSGKPNG